MSNQEQDKVNLDDKDIDIQNFDNNLNNHHLEDHTQQPNLNTNTNSLEIKKNSQNPLIDNVLLHLKNH